MKMGDEAGFFFSFRNKTSDLSARERMSNPVGSDHEKYYREKHDRLEVTRATSN